MAQGGFTAMLLIRSQIARCIEKQRSYAETWSDDELLRESARAVLTHLEAAQATIEETLGALQIRGRFRPKAEADASAEPKPRRRRIPKAPSKH